MRIRLAVVAILLFVVPMTGEDAWGKPVSGCTFSEGDPSAYQCAGSASGSTPVATSQDSFSTGDPHNRLGSASGVVQFEPIALRTPGGSIYATQISPCLAKGSMDNEFIDLCPDGPPTTAADSPDSPQQQAQNWVEQFFRNIAMPEPKPQMSAPDGVCGVMHSLDLQVPSEHLYSSTTPFGQLTLHAYATTYVNWGDSTKERFHSTGAPYPNSTISHSWQNRGNYLISTQLLWSADWSIGTLRGTVTGAQTSATINFQVLEMQARITRG